MSTQKSPIEDPELLIESAIVRTESYIQKHFTKIIIAVAAIIVVTGGYFGYKGLIESPRIEKASAAAYTAEQYFQVDSFKVALEGNEFFDGFITIADKYSATPVGNIANQYAGICYLRLGDFDNALTYLKRYKSVDGKAAEVINAQNLGLQGDIASQKGDKATAIKQYKAAAEIVNSFTAPTYLKKLGLIYQAEGDNSMAIETFKKITDLYPSSLEARDIEKFIGRIEK